MKRWAAISIMMLPSLWTISWNVSTDDALSIKLTSGVSTTTVTDGGAGDLCAAAGCVTFSGGVGNFTLNMTTGTTLGPSVPDLNLNSIDVTNTKGGTLTIWASDQGYTLPAGPKKLISAVGGTSNPGSNLTAQQWFNTDNVLFSTSGFTPGLQGPFGPPAYAGTSTVPFLYPGGPFSLTEKVDITHTGATRTGLGSLRSTVVASEPGIMMILGGGLIGLAGWGKRRFSK